MHELWFDYVKQKYGENLCYMDTDTLIVYIQTDDRFDTSYYELDKPLPKEKIKNKKVIGLMNDELGGIIKTKFIGLRAKIYSYLIDDHSEYKKAKGTRK